MSNLTFLGEGFKTLLKYLKPGRFSPVWLGSVPSIVKTNWGVVGLMHQHEGVRIKANQPP